VTADLALAADPGFLERSADPAEFVIQACERAKVWLQEVLDHGDIGQIIEVKSQAEAIRVYTMQKNLGKDAGLSAQEIVRRAERGIGAAIRRGQEDGTIRKSGQFCGNGLVDNASCPQPVTDFATHTELTGNSQQPGFYDLTDGVPDEQFEEAIGEARAEGNLSRASVARKVRARKPRPEEWVPDPGDNHGDAPVQRRKLIRTWAGQDYSSRQIAQRLSMRDDVVRRIAREMGVEIPADQFVVGTRRHDSNRIVRETVHALEGLAMGVGLVDPGDLDPAQAGDWADSLTESIKVLSRLTKTMRKAVQ
jgi:hypothetical protein